MDDNNKNWRFCVVGNITKQHLDENGNILYGAKAFVGGTKVYIDDRTFNLNEGMVSVIGLNRYGRYAVENIPIDLIENIRLQRVFKPKVLEIMNHLEVMDGWVWHDRTAEDKRALNAFIKVWNELQSRPIQGVDY